MPQAKNVKMQNAKIQADKKQIGKLQAEMTKGLTEVFGLVHSERKKYYASGKTKPTKKSIDSIINNYTNANTLITGSTSLVPGPLGMAAAIPELILIVRNQLSMCYDIGMAYEQEDQITKELLLAVLVSSSGIMGLGLLKVDGSTILVQRLSLRIMQKVIAVIGEKITQRAIRSMLSKWVPGLGATAMAIWSRLETQAMAKKATEIFSKEIKYTAEKTDEDITLLLIDPLRMDKEFLIDKLKLLINMMKIDGIMHMEELEMIKLVAANDNLQGAELEELLTKKKVGTGFKVKLRKYAKEPLKATAIVIELAALAKSDGEMDIREKAYLKWVCLRLGVDEKKLNL